MFSAHAFTILCTGIWMVQSATGSTISDVSSINVTVGDTALIPWNYSLTGGQTVDEIIWTKPPATSILTVRTGSPTPIYGPGYSTRASTTAGTAYLQLAGIVSGDEGTYRCQIVFNDLSEVEDEAQLFVTVPTTAPPPTVPVTAGEVPTTAPPPTVPVTAGEVEVDVGQGFTSYGDATLQCSYTTTLNASTGRLTWSFGNKAIYQRTGSNEFFADGYQDRLTFIGDLSRGNADIRFNKMKRGDTGNYTCSVTVPGAGQDSGSIKVTVWLPAEIGGLTVGVTIAVALLSGLIGCCIAWSIRVHPVTITVHPSPNRKVDVEWTGKRKANYKVLYRLKGSKDWTHRPEVSTDNHPNYKYMVDFAQDGSYEVCVQATIACCSCCNMKSKIEGVTVPDKDFSAAPGSLNGPNMPVSLHGNDIPKTDVPLVVMITEGQSHKVKLDPIIIDKQNPAEKKEKKKKKRKKVNKVNASDEDKKPED